MDYKNMCKAELPRGEVSCQMDKNVQVVVCIKW